MTHAGGPGNLGSGGMSAAARRMQDDTVGWLLGVVVGPTACESLQFDGAVVAVIGSSGGAALYHRVAAEGCVTN